MHERSRVKYIPENEICMQRLPDPEVVPPLLGWSGHEVSVVGCGLSVL